MRVGMAVLFGFNQKGKVFQKVDDFGVDFLDGASDKVFQCGGQVFRISAPVVERSVNFQVQGPAECVVLFPMSGCNMNHSCSLVESDKLSCDKRDRNSGQGTSEKR